MSMADIGVLLSKKGVRPSPQRLRIFNYLKDSMDHPQAEQIYRNLVGEMPTLSRTTVYNTLHLFVQKGLVNAVGIEGAELRYDAETRQHAHFKCVVCQRIMDVPEPDNVLSGDGSLPEGLDGCLIHSRHLYYKGICRDCRDGR